MFELDIIWQIPIKPDNTFEIPKNGIYQIHNKRQISVTGFDKETYKVQGYWLDSGSKLNCNLQTFYITYLAIPVEKL